MSTEIACKLTASEIRSRKELLQNELLPNVLYATELKDGYTLWFPRNAGELARIAELVELESECCDFLTFVFELAAGASEIGLSLTGPDGTKEVLEEGFLNGVEVRLRVK